LLGERDIVCILFSNCIYRRDRINFHYAVETLLQLTDIAMKKLKKKHFISTMAWPTLGGEIRM